MWRENIRHWVLEMICYQAVDIGHIDLEYEWFLKGKGFRTLVKGKYNNEINDNACLSEIKDTVYAEQVLFDLS